MGKPWDEFLMKWGQFENVNYRLHDLEVYESAGPCSTAESFTDSTRAVYAD
jgi:hypothetical protein